jgi:Response regulator containing a CheY-like receiver domain and an HD-GYP domain
MDTILVVDDVEINRTILKEMLSAEYDVLEADSGRAALDILFNIPRLPDAILLDIMMPGMDGFEVLNFIKSNPKTASLPVLFITTANASENESRGLNEGAVDFIAKPFNADVIKARLHNHVQLKKYQQNLQLLLDEKIAEIINIHEHMLETMASLIEYRSLESGEHIQRTSKLSRVLINHLMEDSLYARELMHLNPDTITKAVTLHDIGKIAIPDNILLKPGKLTENEFETIKTHSAIGSDIIRSMRHHIRDSAGYLTCAQDICRSHHERWDGRGYPDGLAGTDIPLAARILSVVDVYDALVNIRCYKPKMPHDEAVSIIMNGRGTQFDPVVADAFYKTHNEFAELERQSDCC